MYISTIFIGVELLLLVSHLPGKLAGQAGVSAMAT